MAPRVIRFMDNVKALMAVERENVLMDVDLLNEYCDMDNIEYITNELKDCSQSLELQNMIFDTMIAFMRKNYPVD